MNRRDIGGSFVSLIVLMCCAGSAFAQTPLGSGFTYQGQLNLSGGPVNDMADFEFTLWDAAAGGNMIGSAVDVSNIAVVDGLFAAQLDFGATAFNGDARWLEVKVASPSGGSPTTLSPRQPLTAVPYSLQTRGIYVTSGGNVGIGTTAPGAKLGVVGDMRLSGKLQSSSGNLDLSGGGAGVSVLLDEDGGSNDAFVISDTGVERFRVDGNTGTVTAPAFVGDGSGLTNVTASQIISGAGVVRVGHGVEVYTRPVLLDQQNTLGNQASSSMRTWQSFTAGVSGDLAVIEVRRSIAGGMPGSAADVRIYNGEGTAGTFLGSGSIPESTSVGNWQATSIEPIPVVAGNQYTIELVGTSQLWWMNKLSDVYPGGLGAGDPNRDFVFRTYVLDDSGELSLAMVADLNGNVGIGTSAPAAKLDVAGTVNATAFSGDGSALTNVPGDDLGNHTATQSLDMNSFDISNAATITASAFVGDGSGLTNVSAQGDNLGDHTATQALNMNSFDINNAGTVTAAAFVGNGSGLVGVSASEIATATGMVRIGRDLKVYTWATSLDQEYDAVGVSSIGLPVVWQSFTAGATGDLAAVDVYIRVTGGIPGVPANVRIYEGEGTAGPLLGVGAVPLASAVQDDWQTASLQPSVPVVAGNQYTIELSGTGPVRWGFKDPGTYDGGRASNNAAWDHLFRTYVLDPAGNLTETLTADSRGLRFGENLQYAPPAYDRQTMIVAGKIMQDGSLDTSYTTSGAITGSVRDNDGDYTITFAEGTFSKTPIITVQPSEAGNGDSFRVVTLSNESTTGFHVKMKDRQGDNENAPFHFTAIGER